MCRVVSGVEVIPSSCPPTSLPVTVLITFFVGFGVP